MAGEYIQLAQAPATGDAATADPAALGAAPVDGAAPPADGSMAVDPAAVTPDAGIPAGDDVVLDVEAAGDGGGVMEVTEEVENPYGLAQLWGQGDFVARGTLIILVLMSLYSWFIMLTKLWEQQRLLRQAKQASREFWTGSSLAASAEKLSGNGNAFRAIVDSAIKASEHHEGKLTDRVPLADWISGNLQRNVDRMHNDLQGGLSFLASVGSTAPFVGLFGTVWGIYHALIAIGIAGQASIDKVAGPVGEALIMTAIGLAVAVPAVLGYNWLLRRNKAIMDQFRYFTNDLYATLVSGSGRK